MTLSLLGAHIERHRPASESWLVQILMRDDWNAIFDAAGLPRRYKVNTAETALIRHYRPLLNRTSHPDHFRPPTWMQD